MLPCTVSCDIGNILVSDHAMVSLNLAPADSVKKSTRWRFNSSLLQDDAFKAMLKTQIDIFIETNVPSSPSAGTTWEAFKAFIRGHVILFSSYKKKQSMSRLAILEKKVEEAEQQLKRDFSPHNLGMLTKLKCEYNQLLSQKVEFGLFRARQKYFESGDKAGKLLAHYIKQQESMATITAVQSEEGAPLTKPTDINEAFVKFYRRLYSSS